MVDQHEILKRQNPYYHHMLSLKSNNLLLVKTNKLKKNIFKNLQLCMLASLFYQLNPDKKS